jgi:hypothetical protein
MPDEPPKTGAGGGGKQSVEKRPLISAPQVSEPPPNPKARGCTACIVM